MSLDLTNNNEIIVCTNQEDTESRDYTYLSSWNGSNTCLSTYTAKCGIDEYEDSSTENTCIAVSIWEYSPANNNDAETCTNNEDTTSRNYTYTSDGNGTNSCSATYTDKCWVDLYETVNGTCAAVWNWSYSLASNNDRIACTNNEDTTSRNYTYTSDGNGWNNCSATYTDKCWVDEYETENWTCSAVGYWYYSAIWNNWRIACSNWPTDTASRDYNYSYVSDWNGTNSCEYLDWCGSWDMNGDWLITNWEILTALKIYLWKTVDIPESSYSIADVNCDWNINLTDVSKIQSAVIWTITIAEINETSIYTDLCWVDEYETENWTCSAVGYWYYSAIWNNWRIACSNWPTDTASRDYNYSYVSDWNGTNSCEYLDWCGSWDMNGDWLITNWEILTALKIYLWKTVDIPESSYSIADVNCDWNINLTDVSKIQSAVIWTITIAEINETSIYTDLCWVDEYETENWTCSAVGYWYYSASWNNGRSSCSNWPTNSTYTSDWNGSNSCTYIQ